MKKKGNVWLPVAIILGVLIALFLVLTAAVALKGRLSIGKADAVETEDTEDAGALGTTADGIYLSDVALEDFSASSGAEQQAQTQEDSGVLENEEDYILPDSGTTALTDADLEGLTAQELTYARNEIYARHGRVFESQELNDYFQGKSWYTADPDFDDSEISDLESANAGLISAYQNDHDLTYAPQ